MGILPRLGVTRKSLETITREDLLAFHRRYYSPNRMIFAIQVIFKPDQMLHSLEVTMEGWQRSLERVPPVPTPAFHPKPRLYMVNKPGATLVTCP